MKKINLLLCGAVLLSAVGISTGVDAAEKTAKTEGKVTFMPAGDGVTGPIVKPGTDEEIEIDMPGEGSNTSGPLRMEFVPGFDFMVRNTAYKATEYNPRMVKAKYSDGGINTGAFQLPHFVQVTDERGEQKGWSVVAQMDTVLTSGTKTLPNTVIRLKAEKMYITDDTGSDVSTILSGLVLPGTGYVEVSTTGPTNILKTKENQNSDSRKSSIVFSDSYDPTQVTTPYTVETLKNDEGKEIGADGEVLDATATDADKVHVNPGVALYKPKGEDVSVKELYKADITWTLEDSYKG